MRLWVREGFWKTFINICESSSTIVKMSTWRNIWAQHEAVSYFCTECYRLQRFANRLVYSARWVIPLLIAQTLQKTVHSLLGTLQDKSAGSLTTYWFCHWLMKWLITPVMMTNIQCESNSWQMFELCNNEKDICKERMLGLLKLFQTADSNWRQTEANLFGISLSAGCNCFWSRHNAFGLAYLILTFVCLLNKNNVELTLWQSLETIQHFSDLIRSPTVFNVYFSSDHHRQERLHFSQNESMQRCLK